MSQLFPTDIAMIAPRRIFMGQSCRDLIAWQKAMDFVMDVYRTSKAFPRDELYGLASRVRRAAVAVPTNIAEGQARFSANEFHYFLGRARGSLVEVETQLMIAQKLAYFSPEHGKDLLDKSAELGKILNGLIGSIRQAT
jgi:four helix bundle protein